MLAGSNLERRMFTLCNMLCKMHRKHTQKTCTQEPLGFPALIPNWLAGDRPNKPKALNRPELSSRCLQAVERARQQRIVSPKLGGTNNTNCVWCDGLIAMSLSCAQNYIQDMKNGTSISGVLAVCGPILNWEKPARSRWSGASQRPHNG